SDDRPRSARGSASRSRSALDDPRDPEELAEAIGRVPEHLVLREGRHDLVVAHHVDERHGVRRWLDAGDVERSEPGEPRDVEHLLPGDHWSGGRAAATPRGWPETRRDPAACLMSLSIPSEFL